MSLQMSSTDAQFAVSSIDLAKSSPAAAPAHSAAQISNYKNNVDTAKQQRVIWTLTPGAAGFMSQSIGLARAVGGTISEKETRLRRLWRFMPLTAIPHSKRTIYKSHALDAEPAPDLVISCGRQSISAAMYLRKKYGARVFNVHIQDPTIDPAHFDLVVAPKHDGARGPNVYQSMGALRQSKLSPTAPGTPTDGLRPLLLAVRTSTTRFPTET
jgi:hypothetical protein